MPAEAGGLDEMISRGPFQPLPFCDSVILCGLTVKAGQRGQPLPRPAHCAPADAALDAAGHLCCQGRLLAYAAPQPGSHQPIVLPVVLPSKRQDFTSVLDDFHKVSFGLFLKLV